jgi:quinol monooxygenase YgiN
MQTKKTGLQMLVIGIILVAFCFCGNAPVQNKDQMVRLAKIVVDSAQLESYKALLREEIEASLRVEPGVLTLYAVAEKTDPTRITILEIYADSAAYLAHIKTPHFLKYKTGTLSMVKSLELVAAEPLLPGTPIKNAN